MRPLKIEWNALQQKIKERNGLLESAVNFHRTYNSYMKRATEWVHLAGADQSNVMSMSAQELEQLATNHKAFKDKYESAYSEAFSCSVGLRKKLERNAQSSHHSSLEFVSNAIESMIRMQKQLTNIWESKNTSIRQRLQSLLLFPEVETVIQWLNVHGETFLKRKIAIGHDYQSAKSLENNHQKFRSIAESTYQNAKDLFKAAEEVMMHGDVDVARTRTAVDQLRHRITSFTQKVDSRTKLLYVAKNFFMHYSEIMSYYGKLEQRDRQIRWYVLLF
jgi:hypothetical protein